jgi:tetratricopeptide (TPR) repeat protein
MVEFKHRDYEAALAGFRFFLELYGQSDWRPTRNTGWKNASTLKSFYNVVSYYPLSPKLAASTLKIGQTYAKLEDHEKARMTYARVVDHYPESAEAELAHTADVSAIHSAVIRHRQHQEAEPAEEPCRRCLASRWSM